MNKFEYDTLKLKKDLEVKYNLIKNDDHFKACFRNISEDNLELLHSLLGGNAEMFKRELLEILEKESQKRINRLLENEMDQKQFEHHLRYLVND